MLRSYRSLFVVVIAAGVAPIAMASASPVGSNAAWAQITGGGSGLAILRELPASDALATKVHVVVQAEGLTAGNHGVQIVAAGDCVAAATAGDLDLGPAADTSGSNHPKHTGDLPNLVDHGNGTWSMSFTTSRFTLSAGPRSILSGPAAIVVRAGVDSGSSGANGGAVVACGVIAPGNPNVPVPSPSPSGSGFN